MRSMTKTVLASILLSLLLGLSAGAEETMKSVAMATTIGEGADQQVTKLYESPWTKLVQITLRNGKTLSTHSAKEAVTIQCVSGEGTLVLGDERIALTPGVIVPVEPNVPHAVETKAAVSVLVTRFTAATATTPHQH